MLYVEKAIKFYRCPDTSEEYLQEYILFVMSEWQLGT
jgi:hypothetical protein